MKKNVAGQKIGAQLVTAADGTEFTGAVTISVTGDAGTMATGSVGSGACAHEGHGYHTYAPAQAETNYDLIAFTFYGTGAITVTVQVEPDFPQTGDNFARLGAPAGASVSADVAAVKVDSAAILVDTGTTLDARIPAALVGGRIDASVGAMAAAVLTASAIAADAITAPKIADGAIDALTFAAGAINAAAIAGDAITAAKIADGAIDAATFAAGAINAAAIAADAITAAKVASDVSVEIADQVWDEAIAGHAGVGSTGEALGAAGSAGDPWTTALPGAYGAGTAGKLIGDNVNATISSRATQTSVDDVPTNAELTTALGTADDAMLAAIAALNNLSIANIRTAVGLASANMDAQLATISAFIDSEIAAIKAKTDQLTFTKANEIDSNIQSINGVTLVGDGSATPFGV